MTRRYNYLYVEDDPLSREVMETLLLEVLDVNSLVIFNDSDNFLDRLTALEDKPDFIMLDIHVEPHNGYELLTMLRQNANYTDANIIAVTASVMTEEIKQLRSQGFDGALAKPLDMITFPDLIKQLEAGEKVWQVS